MTRSILVRTILDGINSLSLLEDRVSLSWICGGVREVLETGRLDA